MLIVHIRHLNHVLSSRCTGSLSLEVLQVLDLEILRGHRALVCFVSCCNVGVDVESRKMGWSMEDSSCLSPMVRLIVLVVLPSEGI